MAVAQSNIESAADQSSTSFTASSPKIELPKGGGAIRGIGEKFAANPVTGTNIPIQQYNNIQQYSTIFGVRVTMKV